MGGLFNRLDLVINNCSFLVNITGHCHDLHSPVCDNKGKTHSSLCHLIRSKEVLAYQSACNRNCNNNQVVCGINGVTYHSECEAWSGKSFVFQSKIFLIEIFFQISLQLIIRERVAMSAC